MYSIHSHILLISKQIFLKANGLKQLTSYLGGCSGEAGRARARSPTPDPASGYKSLAPDKRNSSLVAMLLYPTMLREKKGEYSSKGSIVRRYKEEI